MLLSVNCYSQVNRFYKPQQLRSTYGLENDLRSIQNDVKNHPDCVKMKIMATGILSTMSNIANEPAVVDYYKERNLYFSHAFDNSSWVRRIEYFNNSGGKQNNFVVMTTHTGSRYFFPNVPKRIFYDWQFARSPGKYYHRKVSSYSLGEILRSARCL